MTEVLSKHILLTQKLVAFLTSLCVCRYLDFLETKKILANNKEICKPALRIHQFQPTNLHGSEPCTQPHEKPTT